MSETRIEIQNKQNEKLIGIETKPDKKQVKYPTVILVHGFGVNKSESGMFDELAKHLAEDGIVSYRFDFSGLGESQGDYLETSLTKLKEDLDSVLNFVKSKPYLDQNKIGIHAQSLGTSTTIALHPEIKTIILTGAVAHPKDRLITSFGNGYNPEGISERYSESTQRLIKVNPKFWKDFDNYNLPELIKQIHCPILFIHGSLDDKVPQTEMEELFQNANEPKQKVLLEGADHGLNPKRELMYKIATKWFSEQLA